jgi:uncharacterized protein (DUF302 family)
MNKRVFYSVFTGLIVGIVATMIVLYYAAPSILFIERESRFGYSETIAAIHESSKAEGWIIPKQYELDVSLSSAGYDVLPVSVIELCKPEHAYKILGNDEYRLVSSLMPCRVAVYKKADGTTIISRMNTGLLSRVFAKTVRDVMGQATQETNTILGKVER